MKLLHQIPIEALNLKLFYINKKGVIVLGTRAREIVDLDVDNLIELLRKALADEWLAYYQYWVGAKVVKGPTKDEVIAELVQHATEELAHAELLSNRIIQLGGEPILDPKDWFELTNCGYDAPDNGFVIEILKQNIKGEQCAIGVYKKLLDLTKDKDSVTYNMVLSILSDEIEHEEDLQSLLEDLELLYENVKNYS